MNCHATLLRPTELLEVRCWVLLIALFSGQAIAEHPTSGRLVIVGGALRPTNELIYRKFVDGLDDQSRVGIVPLACGVPDRSGPSSVEDIQQYVAHPERVFDTKLTNNQSD